MTREYGLRADPRRASRQRVSGSLADTCIHVLISRSFKMLTSRHDEIDDDYSAAHWQSIMHFLS